MNNEIEQNCEIKFVLKKFCFIATIMEINHFLIQVMKSCHTETFYFVNLPRGNYQTEWSGLFFLRLASPLSFKKISEDTHKASLRRVDQTYKLLL